MSFDLKITNGDISINRDGTLSTVIDNEKLKQDIIKILLTKLNENKFHPRYGSEIGSLKIGHIQDRELLELDLTASAEESIEKLIFLQRSQSRRQFLTPGEKLVSLLDVSVERDLADPRMYNIFLSIQTGALTIISESVTIRII